MTADALLLGVAGRECDIVTLRGVSARGHHGVFEHERLEGQMFSADVTALLRRPARTDDLETTVHYGELAEDVAAVLAGEPVALIETVAEHIAEVALQRALIEAVVVTVHKPSAPITVPFDDVSVTVVRRR